MATEYFQINLTITSTIYRPDPQTPITPTITIQYVMVVDTSNSPGLITGIYRSSNLSTNLLLPGTYGGSDDLFTVSTLQFGSGANFQDNNLYNALLPYYPINGYPLINQFQFFYLDPNNLLAAYTGAGEFSSIWFISMSLSSVSDPFPSSTSSTLACFHQDTKILTDNGYRPIHQLRNGDRIKTYLHGYQPIVMIGYRNMMLSSSSEQRSKDQLYRCTPLQFPELMEDLIMTGCHAILVDSYASKIQEAETKRVLGRLCVTDDKARLPACVDDRTLLHHEDGDITIYHLALAHDDYYMNYGIYANGLLVETCSQRYLKELSGMTLIP